MIPTVELIWKIRAAIHDQEKLHYDESEILTAINGGLRFIRRTVAELRPDLLISCTTGILPKYEDTIKLDKAAIKIARLSVGYDNLISCAEGRAGDTVFANLQHLHEKKFGKPQKFCRVGLKELKIYPTPKLETTYTVYKIDDINDVELNESTPILNEFDDFLYEYAVARLSLKEEYDMTQEQAIMANIHQQIVRLLNPPPAGVIVRSYW